MNRTLECFEINEHPVQVIRANRLKTIGIKVHKGRVSIRAPKKMPLCDIKTIIVAKQSWIEKKIKQQQETPSAKIKQYITGECFYYLGEAYTLQIKHDNEASVTLEQKKIVLTLPQVLDTPMYRKKILIRWYTQQAETYLDNRVLHYQKYIGKKPMSLKIRLYKSRWGSCSTTGNITFNWLILMAPKPVIDYVVVHELCHLIQHNHSLKFWGLVEKVIPEYSIHARWLKQQTDYFIF